MRGGVRRVLLVEDDKLVARAISRVLRHRGLDVVVAGSCAEALADLTQFHLGILDIDLPDGDGVELARRLTSRATCRRILFFSGSHDMVMRYRAGKYGAVIDKTESVSTLIGMVESACATATSQAVGGGGGIETPLPPSGLRRS